MERKLKKCLSVLVDLANLFKAFIGVNYLTISFALMKSGIALGIGGLILIAVATVHGCHLLIICKRIIIQNILEANFPSENQSTKDEDIRRLLRITMEKRLSYGDVATLAWGKLGTIVVNFAVVVTQFGFCVNYFIFLGNTFDRMFPYFLPYITLNESKNTTHVPTTSDVGSYNIPDSNVSNSSSPANIEPFTLVSRSPGYCLLVLVPLPLFVLFAYLRSIRNMGPVSIVANISVFVGYISVMIYLLEDFSVSNTVSWVQLSTFPIFFGQVTASFEGVGTIVPIESSMEGNHHLFAHLLHLTVFFFTLVLASLGYIGYLKLGTDTDQVILWNLPEGSPLQLVVCLVISLGVLFTFPLQCFPVIGIFEEMIFAHGTICGIPTGNTLHVKSDEESDEVPADLHNASINNGESQLLLQAELSTSNKEVQSVLKQLPIATQIPDSVSAWKRNVVRTLIVLAQLGLALVLRNDFAYFGAFTGAIGSTLIAYIIPAAMHLKLRRRSQGILYTIKDILLIVIGVVGGVTGVYTSVLSMIKDQV